MVTYELLKSGYILQQNDELVLHGVNYEVKFNQPDGNYLFNDAGVNSRVFDILGMEAEERRNFVKRFNPVRYGEAQDVFPEFSDLKALTNLVIALYEVPEYKKGDWVTIVPRRESDDYSPVIYADKMVQYAGNTYQVERDYLRKETLTCNGAYNGDPHTYTLDGASYYWTSQMIRKATEEEIRRAKGEVKDFDRPTYIVIGQGLKAQIEETAKRINYLVMKIPNDPIWDIVHPTSAPCRNDTPSNTEIRLPNNEEETPHIKL